MNTPEKTSKYIGAVSAFLVVNALLWLPGTFQIHTPSAMPWASPFVSLGQVVLLLLTGVGLFCRWRGFWHMAVAWLTLQLAGSIFTYSVVLSGLHVPLQPLPSIAFFVSILQVLCLLVLFRRDTRASYEAHAA